MSRISSGGGSKNVLHTNGTLVEDKCTFTMMTYNVNFGPFVDMEDEETIKRVLGIAPQASRVIDAIAEADADIVCLQETNFGMCSIPSLQ